MQLDPYIFFRSYPEVCNTRKVSVSLCRETFVEDMSPALLLRRPDQNTAFDVFSYERARLAVVSRGSRCWLKRGLGFGVETVEDCLARLSGQGMLRDIAYVAELVSDRNPHSPIRIVIHFLRTSMEVYLRRNYPYHTSRRKRLAQGLWGGEKIYD